MAKKKKKAAKKTAKKAATKRAPAKKMKAKGKAKSKTKAKPKSAARSKVTAKVKSKNKNSNVVSFTELFELKKQQMAEHDQPAVWKENTPDAQPSISEHAKAPVNVRNGRTNGAGVRHK